MQTAAPLVPFATTPSASLDSKHPLATKPMTTMTTMTEPTQHIAIVIKFVPATNYHGSRISLSLPRWDGKRKVIPYDHSYRDTEEGARAWLNSKGINPSVLLDLGDHYCLACDWSQREAIFSAFGIPERN